MNDRTMLAALLVLSLIFGSGCTSAHVSIGQAMRDYRDKRIAVLDVTKPQKQGLRWTILVAGEIGTGTEELMSQSLESSLMDTGLFQMVDRSHLDRVLEEQHLSASGLVDTTTAIKIGRLAGVDGIVALQSYGNVVWVGPIVVGDERVVARLIDVKTGSIVWSARGNSFTVTIVPIPPVWIFIKTLQSKMADSIAKELKESLEQ